MRHTLWGVLVVAIVGGGCQPYQPAPAQLGIDHYVAAQLMMDDGQTDQAMAELLKAVDADPDLSTAHAAMGQIHATRREHQAARDAYHLAFEANPYNMDLREELARCYEQLGDADKAEQIRSGTAELIDVP